MSFSMINQPLDTQLGVAQKTGTKMEPFKGETWTKPPRNPCCLILSHTQINPWIPNSRRTRKRLHSRELHLQLALVLGIQQGAPATKPEGGRRLFWRLDAPTKRWGSCGFPVEPPKRVP